MINRRTILIVLLCNPLSSVLLVAALLFDVRQLAENPGSVCGEWFAGAVLGRGWQSFGEAPYIPCCAIIQGGEGIRLVPTSQFDCTGAPGAVDWIGKVQFGPSRSGFWALTREETLHRAEFLMNNQQLTPGERAEARRLFVDNYISGDPEILKRLRGENFIEVRTLWTGCGHNAISLTVLLLLVWVTWVWVRAILSLLPYRRAAARLELGLCPACAYPVVGLIRCPECGLAAAAGAGVAG